MFEICVIRTNIRYLLIVSFIYIYIQNRIYVITWEKQ